MNDNQIGYDINEDDIEKVGEGKVDEFLVLPSNVAVAQNPDPAARRRTDSIDAIGADNRALDIGETTIK